MPLSIAPSNCKSAENATVPEKSTTPPIVTSDPAVNFEVPITTEPKYGAIPTAPLESIKIPGTPEISAAAKISPLVLLLLTVKSSPSDPENRSALSSNTSKSIGEFDCPTKLILGTSVVLPLRGLIKIFLSEFAISV